MTPVAGDRKGWIIFDLVRDCYTVIEALLGYDPQKYDFKMLLSAACLHLEQWTAILQHAFVRCPTCMISL